MSSTKELNDLFKSAPNAANLQNMKVPMIDTSGNLMTAYASSLRRMDLYGAEADGSVMTLKDFTVKYVESCSECMFIANSQNNASKTWHVLLPDGTKMNTQCYDVFIAKKVARLSSDWSYINLMFLPATQFADGIWLVCQSTAGSPDKYKCQIFKMPLGSAIYSS